MYQYFYWVIEGILIKFASSCMKDNWKICILIISDIQKIENTNSSSHQRPEASNTGIKSAKDLYSEMTSDN